MCATWFLEGFEWTDPNNPDAVTASVNLDINIYVI
jgi:hypothetical protein